MKSRELADKFGFAKEKNKIEKRRQKNNHERHYCRSAPGKKTSRVDKQPRDKRKLDFQLGKDLRQTGQNKPGNADPDYGSHNQNQNRIHGRRADFGAKFALLLLLDGHHLEILHQSPALLADADERNDPGRKNTGL